MKKVFKKGFFALLILFSISFCATCIFLVNRHYPPSKKETVPAGETFLFQGAKFTVKSAEWIEIGLLSEKDPMRIAVGKEFGYPAEESRAMVITVTLNNHGASPLTVDLSAVNIESGNASSPISQVSNYFGAGAVYHRLEAGETKEVKILQTFYRDHFTLREWNNLTRRQFYFVTSLYPIKQMALIPAKT